MKLLDTIHKRKSATIVTILMILLLLLIFFFGLKYMDPPIESGIAVNFGTSNVGSGNIQPTKPVKTEVKPVVTKEETIPEEVIEEKVEEVAPDDAPAEDVLTSESEESIQIKKAKEEKKKLEEAEANAKAEADRIAKEKADKEKLAKEEADRVKQEQEDKKRQLDAMMGGLNNADGTSGGEGNDNVSGDKGKLNGDPYAPSYFGDSKTGNGGIGYGLKSRGKAIYEKLLQDCNESGVVIVKIVVNQNGNVIEAIPGQKGTSNHDPCLLEPAKKIALSHKWPSDSNAPARQTGFVSIVFKLR